MFFHVDFYMLLSNLLSGAIDFFLKFRMQKYKEKRGTRYHVSKQSKKRLFFKEKDLVFPIIEGRKKILVQLLLNYSNSTDMEELAICEKL